MARSSQETFADVGARQNKSRRHRTHFNVAQVHGNHFFSCASLRMPLRFAGTISSVFGIQSGAPLTIDWGDLPVGRMAADVKHLGKVYLRFSWNSGRFTCMDVQRLLLVWVFGSFRAKTPNTFKSCSLLVGATGQSMARQHGTHAGTENRFDRVAPGRYRPKNSSHDSNTKSANRTNRNRQISDLANLRCYFTDRN